MNLGSVVSYADSRYDGVDSVSGEGVITHMMHSEDRNLCMLCGSVSESMLHGCWYHGVHDVSLHPVRVVPHHPG